MIRKCISSDKKTLVSLWEEFDDFHRTLSDYYFRKPNKKEVEARHNRYLKQKNCLYIVSEHEGEIAGFICGQRKRVPQVSLLRERQILELHGIFIRDKYRNKGYAKELIQAGIDIAKEEKMDDVEVFIWNFNDHIQNIIKSNGFHRVSGKFGLSLNAESK